MAFSDDDVYHYPGWLSAELEVYDAFPNTGMISGYVTPSMFVEERISGPLLNLLGPMARPSSQTGDVVPSSMTISWATSTGRDPEWELEEQSRLNQYMIEYAGVKALAAAHHDQFLSSRPIMERGFPQSWGGRLMGGMVELDQEIDDAGFLRLTTSEQHTQNLGNRFVEEDLVLSTGGREWRTRSPVTSQQRACASDCSNRRP